MTALTLFVDTFYFTLGALVVLAGILAAIGTVAGTAWFLFRAGKQFCAGFRRGWRS